MWHDIKVPGKIFFKNCNKSMYSNAKKIGSRKWANYNFGSVQIYIKTIFIIFSLEDLSTVYNKYIFQFCTISGFTNTLHFLTWILILPAVLWPENYKKITIRTVFLKSLFTQMLVKTYLCHIWNICEVFCLHEKWWHVYSSQFDQKMLSHNGKYGSLFDYELCQCACSIHFG